jgi:ribosomal protein S18 acetylase RimI-like enzyme
MHYRLYTPGDFAALYAIEEVCFQPPFRFSRGYMQRLIRRASATTWIAEEDARMAGFAIVELSRQSGGTVAYIVTLEVLPEFRRRGVGGELLRRVEDSALAADATALWLHVDATNAGAIRLYEEHGYCCEGREENFYAARRPALIYRKVLHTAAAG